MRHLLCALAFLLVPALADAQAATVQYDYPSAGTTPATVQGYVPTLYVNGTPNALPSGHTCAAAGTVITCTATIPATLAGVTPSGPQSFTISLRNGPLESAQSAPLSLTRPAAPSTPRFP